ncbi:MAG: hypothetical protein JEY91_01650 [Spirochaetaceae bacterium]|nr:hypothetical protein [Spirochaetaceae bacterium]
MFWNDTKPLRTLQTGPKIALSLFLILAGFGYLLGFFNILLHYQMVDGKAGLSLKDVQMTYYGSRDKTALEKSIDASMRGYFATDNDYNATKEWLADGASEKDWDSDIKPIFDKSCSTCHSSGAQVAGVTTETYSDVSNYLAQDTGKSIGRLVQVSHTHVLATAPLIFILVLILFMTSFPMKFKSAAAIFSMSAVFLDIGSWWLAKLAPGFAVLVMIGGMCLGLSFGLLALAPLYEMWLKKK